MIIIQIFLSYEMYKLDMIQGYNINWYRDIKNDGRYSNNVACIIQR